MPEILSMFVRKAIAQAPEGLAAGPLYRVAGLTPAEADDPEAAIPADRYYALLEAIAEAEGPRIGFHMRLSGSMGCEDFGAVGLAWKSAPTIGHSFERMDRFSRLYNPVSTFAPQPMGDEWWWTHHRPQPARKGLYLSNEAALATFAALWRDAAGPDRAPLRVQFAHEPLGTTAALQDYFRCPVDMNADRDALVFSAEMLARPNPVGDETIWRFFQAHLEERFPEVAEDSLDRRIVLHIAGALSEGVPGLEQVAAMVGMGARTLQRRLGELGRTFQSLVEEARRELAFELLAESDYSLVEIAFLTGFAEQSSFTRAVKRWSGRTPRQVRAAAGPRPAAIS
ncbi:hypothetical protein B5C34_14430 [Pacificimonas flava]|uniref:HTH araC/xylS-type domain-containing protein n=2 Tax=Pacificimonas TaxID=1960290 RepID=A0A219B8S8_9SPHN|nr:MULTISPECIES: AraC family transcriptional regulator [Pacificimonas]MBZ6380022.1 AraC family transcriptional regulator [Pacificimonas aurantium]OWV34536.1 hypothetical protein B5C34_14430 [Pacificimonas flava]